MRRTKIGYVGCGLLAQKVHIPNFMRMPNCELIALAEKRGKLGRIIQTQYNIPKLYLSHEELARDSEIEAVVVSAGYTVQGDIAADLLRSGKHVFVEKPLAISISAAEKIIEAAREGHARLMVAYMKRYDAGNELAKKIVDEFRKTRKLGDITFVRHHYFFSNWTAGSDIPAKTTNEPLPESPPVELPKGIPRKFVNSYVYYLQHCVHSVNLLRWLLGVDREVKVNCVDLNTDGFTGIVVLDMAGVRTVIESGTIDYHCFEENTQIYFEHGWVKVTSPPLLLRNTSANVEVYEGKNPRKLYQPIPDECWTWSYYREAEHFIQCLQSEESFRSPGKDALNDIRVIEKIYRAVVRKRG